MNITIDFGNSDRGLIPIGFDWPIKMVEEQPKRGFIFKKKSTPNPISLIVVVEMVQCPKELQCDTDKLFVISYKNSDYYCVDKPLRFELLDQTCPFVLSVNLKAVKDCKALTGNMSVSAQLTIYDGKRVYGDKVCSSDLKGIMPVAKIPVHTNVEVKFPEMKLQGLIDLDNEEVQFNRRNPLLKIGQIRLKSNCNLTYIPNVKTDLKLSLYGPDHKEISDALTMGECYTEKGVEVRDLSLNMGLLKNPAGEEARYEIECNGYYEVVGQPDSKKTIERCTCDFVLKRDNVKSTLEVTLDDKILRGQATNRTILKQVNFTKGGQLVRRYKFVIKNISCDDSHENAGVLVKNFKSDFRVLGAELLGARKDEVFCFSGKKWQELRQNNEIFLPNGIEATSECPLTLTLNPSVIQDIKWSGQDCYLFTIICNVEFDYIENKEGVNIDKLETQRFHTTLEQRLYLEPNPEWLCIDYGSSAIVSMYDNRILDLHRRKKEIINKSQQYQRLSKDTLESNSVFLSSDILLHDILNQEKDSPVSSLSSEQQEILPYGDLAVCLSPTSSMIISYFNYQLPCLKMLVGSERLPNNPNYHINYYCKQNDVVKYVNANEVSSSSPGSLLSVMNVFREAYHTLFRYFVMPEVGDLDKVNRLVLTYPNTYTPMHLSLIRNVVRSLFPAIRFDHDCMRFVSESDAVAAYYMRHWSEYHPPMADMKENENILVYDMGAGTLDVSVMEKRYIEGRYELKIVGKLGSCKAGNYLDFIIAKILCELLDPQLNQMIASTEEAPLIINERVNMKLAIKDQIKPKLSDTSVNEIVFSLDDQSYTVSRTDIVNHILFQQYLRDTTEGMVNQMCRYFDQSGLEINTVLMSGRSCRLQPLQEQLKKAVEKRNPKKHPCSFFMLDDPRYSNMVSNDRSKLAVAEGAVAIVDFYSRLDSPVRIFSKKLYGNYGVAFQEIEAKWKYVELLNHNKIPSNDSEAMEYYFNNVLVRGLAATSKIKFIQTYMNEEDTKDQLNKNNMDFISVMGTFNRGDFEHELQGSDELEMRIAITEDDEVVLCLGDMQSVGQHPKGADMESETSRRSFWPVRVTY